MNELAARVLRGDILKTLYYQGAFHGQSPVGSLLLWSALREAGHHEDGAPISRETIEAFVDELAARGFLEKHTPEGFGRLLTDYEAHLSRKGRGLLEGTVSSAPDILVGEL